VCAEHNLQGYTSNSNSRHGNRAGTAAKGQQDIPATPLLSAPPDHRRGSRESEEAGWLWLVTPSISSPSPSPSPPHCCRSSRGGKRGEVEGRLLVGLTPATPVPLPRLPHTLTPSPPAAAAAVGTKGGGGEGKHTTHHPHTRHPHTLPPTAAGRRRKRGWAGRTPQSGYRGSAR
ncbi:unnamed protein product, partial [Closterium sp. NIES-54]